MTVLTASQCWNPWVVASVPDSTGSVSDTFILKWRYSLSALWNGTDGGGSHAARGAAARLDYGAQRETHRKLLVIDSGAGESGSVDKTFLTGTAPPPLRPFRLAPGQPHIPETDSSTLTLSRDWERPEWLCRWGSGVKKRVRGQRARHSWRRRRRCRYQWWWRRWRGGGGATVWTRSWCWRARGAAPADLT